MFSTQPRNMIEAHRRKEYLQEHPIAVVGHARDMEYRNRPEYISALRKQRDKKYFKKLFKLGPRERFNPKNYWKQSDKEDEVSTERPCDERPWLVKMNIWLTKQFQFRKRMWLPHDDLGLPYGPYHSLPEWLKSANMIRKYDWFCWKTEQAKRVLALRNTHYAEYYRYRPLNEAQEMKWSIFLRPPEWLPPTEKMLAKGHASRAFSLQNSENLVEVIKAHHDLDRFNLNYVIRSGREVRRVTCKDRVENPEVQFVVYLDYRKFYCYNELQCLSREFEDFEERVNRIPRILQDRATNFLPPKAARALSQVIPKIIAYERYNYSEQMKDYMNTELKRMIEQSFNYRQSKEVLYIGKVRWLGEFKLNAFYRKSERQTHEMWTFQKRLQHVEDELTKAWVQLRKTYLANDRQVSIDSFYVNKLAALSKVSKLRSAEKETSVYMYIRNLIQPKVLRVPNRVKKPEIIAAKETQQLHEIDKFHAQVKDHQEATKEHTVFKLAVNHEVTTDLTATFEMTGTKRAQKEGLVTRRDNLDIVFDADAQQDMVVLEDI